MVWAKVEDEFTTEASPSSHAGDDPRSRAYITSWRTVKVHVAFWLLGFFNSFGFALMLSSAHDIVFSQDHQTTSYTHVSGKTSNTTCTAVPCNSRSSATVLLAAVLPALFVKLALPQFLKVIPANVRVLANVALAICSLLLVALSHVRTASYAGVALMGISVATGEVTYIALLSRFPPSTVSSWSSGTGAAGAAAAWIYLFLRLRLPQRDALLYCLLAPVLMVLVYWKGMDLVEANAPKSSDYGAVQDVGDALELVEPQKGSRTGNPSKPHRNHAPKVSLSQAIAWRLALCRPLLKYMAPLFVVYFSEYLINQGLYELMSWRNCIFIDPHQQYRWFQAFYQLGVFVSRSTMACPRLPGQILWVFAALQLANFGLLLGEVSSHFLPSIMVLFVLTFYEGLLGGACYVGALAHVHREVDASGREFSMSFTVFADTLGVALAALTAMPLHSLYCRHH